MELRKKIGVVSEGAYKLLGNIPVVKMIEQRMKTMAVDELEHMVMSVMKKELNTIVNLGAIIGFLIGILNIFFKRRGIKL